MTRSSRIHSATPSASMRSMMTEQPPACEVSSVVSTCMLRIVSGRRVTLTQRRVVAAVGDDHRAGEQQVVLAVHRALGKAGGAARVGDAGGRQRIDVRRRLGASARRGHGLVPQAGIVAGLGHDDAAPVDVAELARRSACRRRAATSRCRPAGSASPAARARGSRPPRPRPAAWRRGTRAPRRRRWAGRRRRGRPMSTPSSASVCAARSASRSSSAYDQRPLRVTSASRSGSSARTRSKTSATVPGTAMGGVTASARCSAARSRTGARTGCTRC